MYATLIGVSYSEADSDFQMILWPSCPARRFFDPPSVTDCARVCTNIVSILKIRTPIDTRCVHGRTDEEGCKCLPLQNCLHIIEEVISVG